MPSTQNHVSHASAHGAFGRSSRGLGQSSSSAARTAQPRPHRHGSSGGLSVRSASSTTTSATSGGAPGGKAAALQAVLSMHDKMVDVAASLVALGRDAARVAKLRAQIATANTQQLPPQQQQHAPPAHNQAFVTVPGLLQAMGAEAIDTVKSNMARLEEMGRAWHEYEASQASSTNAANSPNSRQRQSSGAIDAVTFLDLSLASVFKSLADLAADMEGPASGCTAAFPDAAPQPHATPITRGASAAPVSVTAAPTPQVQALPPSALRRTDSRTTTATATSTTTTVVSADPPSSDTSSKQRRASVQSPARDRTPQRRAEAAAYVRAPFGAADGPAAAVPPVTPPTRGQSPSRMARAQRPTAAVPAAPMPGPKAPTAELAMATAAIKDARELVGARDAADPVFERRRSERMLHAEHGSKRRLDILARLEQSPPDVVEHRAGAPVRRSLEDAAHHQLPSGEDSNSQRSTPTAHPADRQRYCRPGNDNVTPTESVATTQHRPAVASHTPPTPLTTVMLHKPQNPRSPARGAGVAAIFARHMLGSEEDDDDTDGQAIDVGRPIMPVTFPADDSAVAVIG